MIDTMILSATGAMLLLGVFAVRTAFRWASIYYRHD